MTLGTQLFGVAREENPNCLDLLHMADERHHDPEQSLPSASGPHQRPQLSAEKLRLPQTETNATQAQDRVVLWVAQQLARQLLPTQVVRSHRDRLPRESLQELAVRLDLLILVRQHGARLHEQELGPEQADSPGPAGFGGGDLVEQVDVRQ